MREKLIDLIAEVLGSVNCARLWAKDIADHLLAEGVVVPPCKVGQTLYALWSGGRKGIGVAEFEVRSINLDTPEDMEIVYRSKKLNATMCRYANASDIGKTLFLTREEAEKELERSENETVFW